MFNTVNNYLIWSFSMAKHRVKLFSVKILINHKLSLYKREIIIDKCVFNIKYDRQVLQTYGDNTLVDIFIGVVFLFYYFRATQKEKILFGNGQVVFKIILSLAERQYQDDGRQIDVIFVLFFSPSKIIINTHIAFL